MSETPPVDSNTMPWLWRHNRPILDKLQTVVETLADELVAFVEVDVSKGDGVARETLAVRAQHDIPFGVPYTLLPPRLFSELYAEAEEPRLPRDEAEAVQLVAAYGQRCLAPPINGMPEKSYTVTPETHLQKILDDLMWMVQHGVEINPLLWEQYRQAGREQAEHGRYDLDIISANRSNSIKSLYHYAPLARLVQGHATSTFERYIAMPTVALDVDGHSLGLAPAGYLFMPVGSYGPRFSEKLLRTTAYMVQSAQQVLGESTRDLARVHQDVVARHTTRGHEGRPLDATLISTTQEGARSTMEVIALLTADKVPGFDDPEQLLEAIVAQGIIEEFTRAVPMGMLGPTLFTGKYFPSLLLHTGGGKLSLNPAIMSHVKYAKRAMAQHDAVEWADYWAAPEENRKAILPPVATSLICPAAMPHGALTRMSRAMLCAFRAFRFDI